jgi:type II secretory pathway pseudopilin PulG
MKLFPPVPNARLRAPKAAFTMIEIAMALAIIGFALVAIIGILPMGMDVQKNNRRETIVNQDANFFIEAIRNGARGLDDLTNYVIAISISFNGGTPFTYLNPNPNLAVPAGLTGPSLLTNGAVIVGLLTTPKYTPGGNAYVVAYVKALSGAATEKYPQNNALINEAAFSYRLVPEIVPYGAVTNTYYDETWINPTNRRLFVNLYNNLFDVRLLFRWPLLPGKDPTTGLPKVGNGRKVYRLMVGGNLTNDTAVAPGAYFFQPNTFIPAP